MSDFIEVSKCRICGSADLTPLFSLGEQYVNDFPLSKDGKAGTKAPLTLDMCNVCSLVQLRHTAPPELLYKRFYWYRSGVTDTMRKALRDITRSIEKRVCLKPGDVALDIGSNDGTLLRSYAVPRLRTVGVEPADNLVEMGRLGITQFIHGFWNFPDYWEAVQTKAKVITAIGMFYDLDDPNQFIEDIRRALQEGGLFVAQLMCLRDMVEKKDVGNICHEHLEFYSLRSLECLLNRHGLTITDLERNAVNGSSHRLYIRLIADKYPIAPVVSEAFWEEDRMGVNRPEFSRKFFDDLERNKRACVDFIREETARGKRVWAYGASTKGNVILQYYGLDDSLIDGASDRSPEKWGRVTVGTGIPICSEEEARKANPGYFLVLPYAFRDEFLRRETAWRNDGGRFIFPLPEFEVV